MASPPHARVPFRRLAVACGLALAATAPTGFRDDFDAPIRHDPDGVRGWAFFTGDGQATMTFTSAKGVATIRVDARRDRRNIWWALIKRDVAAAIDVARLAAPSTELRIEARVRSSHAPRRINLSANTQRTTDFHTNLMEFDLPEANVWRTISITTKEFDVRPGDRVNAQLALMDWGLDTYHLDIEYFRVDVVDGAAPAPDLGEPLPYRPALADPRSFRYTTPATQAATIDRHEPDAVLQDWSSIDAAGETRVLTVNGAQQVVLRWDLTRFAGRTAARGGVLELRTHSVRRSAAPRKDFGMVRVVEILGGDPRWDRQRVSYESLMRGQKYEEVFNTQMIVDVDVASARGSATLVTIARPVLQRLLDGRTKGLALIPLGSIDASFLAGDERARAPTLYFDLAP
jgi:hypothetical protein